MSSSRLPLYARATGALLGFGTLIAWPITGHPPDQGTMTFAAGLIVIPNLVDSQSNRKHMRPHDDR